MDILPVDDVDVCIPAERLQPFLFGTDRHGIADILQMIPLFDLLGPGIPRYPQRRDHQDVGNLEVVEQQVVQCRQRDGCLAKAHVKQNGGNLVRFDILNGVLLIIVRFKLHRCHLRSQKGCGESRSRRPERMPGIPTAAKAVSLTAVAAVVSCQGS